MPTLNLDGIILCYIISRVLWDVSWSYFKSNLPSHNSFEVNSRRKISFPLCCKESKVIEVLGVFAQGGQLAGPGPCPYPAQSTPNPYKKKKTKKTVH